MSLADDLTPSPTVLDELPLAAMVCALLVASFFVGLLIGAEATAAGTAAFPPVRLPGLVWGGAATGRFLTVYHTTTTALWVCAGGVLTTTAVATLRERT